MEKLALESLAKKAGEQADGRKEGPPVWEDQNLTLAWAEALGELAQQAGDLGKIGKLVLRDEVVRRWRKLGVRVSLPATEACLADGELKKYFTCLSGETAAWQKYWQLPVTALAVRIVAGAKSMEPLHLSELISSVFSGPVFLLHVDVLVEEGATSAVLDDLSQRVASEGRQCHIFRSLRLAERATLSYVVTEQEQAAELSYQRCHAVLQSGAQLKFLEANLATSLKSVVESVVAGREVSSRLNLVALSGQKSQANFHYRHKHLVGGSTAEINMRAVARGQSKLTLPGMVQISHGAQDTVSNLYQAVLALGDQATIKPIPQLEISANEVQATHSATVSQINQDDYFYAASRGIAPIETERLITRGFLSHAMTDTAAALAPEQLLTAINAYL